MNGDSNENIFLTSGSYDTSLPDTSNVLGNTTFTNDPGSNSNGSILGFLNGLVKTIPSVIAAERIPPGSLVGSGILQQQGIRPSPSTYLSGYLKSILVIGIFTIIAYMLYKRFAH